MTSTVDPHRTKTIACGIHTVFKLVISKERMLRFSSLFLEILILTGNVSLGEVDSLEPVLFFLLES